MTNNVTSVQYGWRPNHNTVSAADYLMVRPNRKVGFGHGFTLKAPATGEVSQ